MRCCIPRAMFIILVSLVIAGLLIVRAPMHVHAAVAYAPGWNLLSGPDGSTLSGAAGNLYTLQPGDVDYKAFPATAALRGGWAYWAYFPTGGSLNATADRATYTVTLNLGQWAMLGNPSTLGVATVAGADTVLTYTPDGGYQDSASVPAGQGAWVQAQGAVTITAPGGSSPPASTAMPSPTPAAAPAFTTYGSLKAVALNAGDLPGYRLEMEKPGDIPGAEAVYEANWMNADTTSPRLTVVEILAVMPSVNEAQSTESGLPGVFLSNAGYQNQRSFGPQPVGDEGQAVSFTGRSASTGRPTDIYVVVFRRGAVVALILTADYVPNGSLATALADAQTVDSRLTGGPPKGGAAPSSSVGSAR